MGQVTSASRLNVQFFANGGVTPIRKTLVSSISSVAHVPFHTGRHHREGILFGEDLGFLDRICGIIERLEDVHQRTLARSALVRTCMKKQPRGKFTAKATEKSSNGY
jgi:hypothetical protein